MRGVKSQIYFFYLEFMEAMDLKGLTLRLKGLHQCVAKLFEEEVVFIYSGAVRRTRTHIWGSFLAKAACMEKPGGNGPTGSFLHSGRT